MLRWGASHAPRAPAARARPGAILLGMAEPGDTVTGNGRPTARDGAGDAGGPGGARRACCWCSTSRCWPGWSSWPSPTSTAGSACASPPPPAAVEVLADWRPHLAVVDMDLARGEMLARLGYTAPPGAARVPVVALTRRGDLQAKLEAFEQGVDDLLSVPFSPEELVARVLAVLRRTAPAGAALRPVLRLGELEIDLLNRRVRAGGTTLHLTSLELSLLYLLAANAGRLLTRDEILDHLWGVDYAAESNVVDRHVRNLRAKLQDDWRRPRYIATVPGRGYRFLPTDPDGDAAPAAPPPGRPGELPPGGRPTGLRRPWRAATRRRPGGAPAGSPRSPPGRRGSGRGGAARPSAWARPDPAAPRGPGRRRDRPGPPGAAARGRSSSRRWSCGRRPAAVSPDFTALALLEPA